MKTLCNALIVAAVLAVPGSALPSALLEVAPLPRREFGVCVFDDVCRIRGGVGLGLFYLGIDLFLGAPIDAFLILF